MSRIRSKLVTTLAKAAAVAAVLFSGQAHALALLGQEPDPSVVVLAGGMEWVYAAPCAGEAPSCGVVQLHHGFAFATDAQWLASFTDLNDLIADFSTPSQKCASTYFSTAHNHCDFSDLRGGFVWHSPFAANASARNNSAAETFLVRALQVPEPGMLALAGLGLACLGIARRKKSS